MDKYVGKRLSGRYLIKELIGVGGMSNVYKATDEINEATVAVKILRDEYLTNPEFLKRFKNESKAIATLSSPNIVRIFDVSFNESSQWIVMEYIDGITLDEYLKKKKVLSWQEAVYFVIPILKALQHAHDKGVVHRDVKPQNIMLLRNGLVKVMDFGIARFARNDTRTITEKAIGSVHYISPEQAKGGNVDEKTDIYSIGVMLFEMVTGKLPFEADNPVSVALKQIQSQPIYPRQLNKTLPVGIEQIIMRALQKDPRNRYQSAADMLNAVVLLKQNPAKVFTYDKGQQMQAGKLKQRESIEKSTKNKDVTNEKEEGISWIKLLMMISMGCCFVAVAIVVGAMFLSGLFSSAQDVVVPNLLGEKFEYVKGASEYSDFVIQAETTEYSDKYAEGEICDQIPKAGRCVKKGTGISIKISLGQKIIKMPDVIGKEYNAAMAELKNLGIDVKEIRSFSDEVNEGLVMRTHPTVGVDVLVGSEVTVYVSGGVEEKMVKTPNLSKFVLSSATTLLEGMKLRLGDVTYVNSEEPKDIVLRQNPEPGVEIEVGTQVDVQASSGITDAKTLTLTVVLPKMNKEVALTAIMDDKVITEETIDITDVRNWKPQFTAKGIHTVQVLINGDIFKECEFDFDEKKVKWTINNTANFVTQGAENTADLGE
ncbi:MAG: Stk1 family PASTA domain-containing Ser/Thr kinase [Oscillospiraceae bacterium]|jgi:serine/threonine-protein kinase|nr:Stk1 family PASTA domain-containing Ser/Thr kinase [Oscillospiraceae bacterium]